MCSSDLGNEKEKIGKKRVTKFVMEFTIGDRVRKIDTYEWTRNNRQREGNI